MQTLRKWVSKVTSWFASRPCSCCRCKAARAYRDGWKLAFPTPADY